MQEEFSEGFVIAGISGRVRNDDPAGIGALWAQFQADPPRPRLGDQAAPEVICLYHDYDGSFTAPYRMTIGHRVPASAPVPEGLFRAEVPAQRMAVFDATGAQPQSVIAQWQAIWAQETAGGLDRAYRADFDLYDPAQPDLVRIHVGLRDA